MNILQIIKDHIITGVLTFALVSECIIISEKHCDQGIPRQMRKFQSNTNILLRRSSKCSTDVKCYVFKMYCSKLYC